MQQSEAVTADSVVKTPLAECDTLLTHALALRIRKGLDYYLERHDECDEGYDLVLRYARGEGVKPSSYLPDGVVQVCAVGRWRCMPRSGLGVATDGLGRTLMAFFDADTLATGVRVDTAGIYAGHFDRYGLPVGHGFYRSADHSLYDGLWSGGMRHGFGFMVSPQKVSVGRWRYDKLLGEHMRYTPERIYGIDIARYQHEKNGKSYPIDWRRLRIAGLGHRASGNSVLGRVDYPVSFVYIKSTEGISIRNKYFVSDYNSSRDHGVAVGCYHFFSTRQDAVLQANYFVSNSRFRRGDLPPMLDVEPSDAMIAAMGGSEALFAAMRRWLAYVEQHVGVRPVIYASQRFVEQYLSQAPDLKSDYPLWVARYSAYKPDAQLTFWQLSADGRVEGIRSEVDISVFNGYRSQWEQFLQEGTIK